ncbi:hypothetical protein HanXRQr2_Chr12g0562291 [Helianthus annuus]|uniref:Uncharacterized protein n=1 Tax=Helianthus annuus TaxID=4232 RepID=A0A9K3HJV3_HELAN|nr:hypothetical protein HanXRQr2_Chr12g0562291 [Helianthus annuus]KAJ0490927.1 hypothetical protein HanHA300_Chr12g0461191 [Helianthus annuus]KAJ0506832.1 hypothetical protein HanHA89_Chr12g0486591 [Helianthus annuus]
MLFLKMNFVKIGESEQCKEGQDVHLDQVKAVLLECAGHFGLCASVEAKVNHVVVEIGNPLLDFNTSFNSRGREIEMFMVRFKIMKIGQQFVISMTYWMKKFSDCRLSYL